MFGGREKSAVAPHLLVDIGSGSVGVALIVPDLEKADKNISSPCLWSERISMGIKAEDTSARLLPKLKATLLEAFLTVNSGGRKILNEVGCLTNITNVHVSIAAPWAITTPRRIDYSKKEPFELNDQLLEKLLLKADNDAAAELAKNEEISKENIHLLKGKIAQLELNGYPRLALPNLKPTTLSTFSFTHYTSFVNKSLFSTLNELIEDNFADSEVSIEPFITIFNQMTLRTTQESSFCLFDVTHEGTEIGIVRDKTLRSITFLPIGTHTLAREIAHSLKTTIDTATHHLQAKSALSSKQSKKQIETVQKTIDSYRSELQKKLSTLPDELAAPAIFYTHTDKEFESFLQSEIATALLNTTDATIAPKFHSYTKLINNSIPYACDSALSLLCFHVLQQFKGEDL